VAVRQSQNIFFFFALQSAFDDVGPWFQGCVVPSLIPRPTIERLELDRKEEDDENKEEETDADVAKRDLIQVSQNT
jgi:hypothetical protein